MTAALEIQPQIIDYAPQLNLGLKIECTPENYIDRLVLSAGIWEPLVVAGLSVLVRPGDVCVDVGANAGYISLLMARYAGESGRVLSFEPNQAVVSKFLRNLSLNSSVQQIIELHSIGLGRAEAQMFVVPDTEVGIGNAGLTSSESAMTTHRVEVCTLDSFNLARLDFMKIDVEGMELDVLEGARNTISRCLPRTIFETLRSLPPEQHKPIEDFFRELGYKIYSMNPRTGQLSEITYPHYPQDDAYAIHPSRL